jgi:hypothetical protein
MPLLKPFTMPVALPTVAMLVLALVHRPPLNDEDKVVLLPLQINKVPVMVPPEALTVISVVVVQPVVRVNVISVVPADIPVTSPDVAPIVAPKDHYLSTIGRHRYC